MAKEKAMSKAILVHDQKLKHFKYFIKHDVDISDDRNLTKHLGYLQDLHYGRKKGIEELGYKIFFIDRPSYLIPVCFRRISPRIYVELLRFAKRMPGIKQLDNLLHNLHLYFIVRRNNPKFMLFCSKRIFRWTLMQCDKYGCDTIEYNANLPTHSPGSWNSTISRNAKYIISCIDITELLDVNIKNSFYRIDTGADNEVYGEPDFDRNKRQIDISVIGTYNDWVFRTRSRILNDFLQKDFISHLTLTIGGFASFKENPKYKTLKQQVTGPIYGQDYINTLKSSKMTIVIPADDNIKIGNGMPLRIFQNAAAGCMQLVYNCDAVNVFKANEEIVLFDDSEDLLEKVKYYLEHDDERVRIARNAHEHFLKEYTAQKLIQKFIKRIYGENS